MAIVKRMVYPPGTNTHPVEEFFDTELGRVVPSPPEEQAAEQAAAEAEDKRLEETAKAQAEAAQAQ
jgi:hypothetical protein